MKYSKEYYWFVIVFFLLFIFDSYYNSYKADEENLADKFSGKVEKVRYDAKQLPYITVNSKEYYIGGYWNYDNSIDTGDFVKKEKGELFITIIKRNKEVIIVKP